MAAFRILTPERRKAMEALYAFSRLTDDIGDADAPADQRSAALSAWKRQTHAALESTTNSARLQILDDQPLSELAPDHGHLWTALADAATRFQIPPELFLDIIAGVEMDIHHQTPENWEQLEKYCYHVASAVGLACSYIWRASFDITVNDDSVWHAASIRCGQAFQLTNILRDVAEDASMRRVYIPREALNTYAIQESQWLSGRAGENWPKLLSQLVSRAEADYLGSWTVLQYLEPRCQRVFSMMWRGYRGLLHKIRENPEQVWSGPRIKLTRWQKSRLLVSHAFTPIYKRLPPPF